MHIPNSQPNGQFCLNCSSSKPLHSEFFFPGFSQLKDVTFWKTALFLQNNSPRISFSQSSSSLHSILVCSQKDNLVPGLMHSSKVRSFPSSQSESFLQSIVVGSTKRTQSSNKSLEIGSQKSVSVMP